MLTFIKHHWWRLRYGWPSKIQDDFDCSILKTEWEQINWQDTPWKKDND